MLFFWILLCYSSAFCHYPYSTLSITYNKSDRAETNTEQEKAVHGIQWDSQRDIFYNTWRKDIQPRADQLLTIASHYPSPNPQKVPVISRQQKARKITQLITPSIITFFIGREKSLKQLRKFYYNKTKRSVQLLAGPGGIGKTQLALKFYHKVQEEYAHTFWLPANSEEQLTSAYLEIAEMLGMYIDTRQVKKTIQEVRIRLADLNCFYVFDDAPDGKVIEAFLPLKQGHVLITSRNNTASTWEHVAKRLVVAPFNKEEIMALAGKFECLLTTEDSASLNYLLEHMSGSPLIMTQFFSLCKKQGYQPVEFVKELQKKPLSLQDKEVLQLLKMAPTKNVNYDKSMLQVLHTCLQQLEQTVQGKNAIKLLSQVAYLDPKSIPVDWICTLLPEDISFLKRETRTALSLLEQYSLIQWDRECAQVYIHETIQQGVRYFRPQSSLEHLVNSLLRYGDKETDIMQNDSEQYVSQWTSLLPHGRILFERLSSANPPQEAAYKLTRYLAKVCRQNGFFTEGLIWGQKALNIAQERYPKQDHPDIAYAWDSVGLAWRLLGKQERGLDHYKQALAMRQQLFKNQDHPDTAYSLNNVGYILLELGKLEEGLSYCKEGLAMRQRIYNNQDHPEVVISLICVGVGLSQLGDLERGLTYFQQALSMQQRIYKNEDRHYTAYALNNVGYTLVRLGKLEEGLPYCKEGLAMRQRIYNNQDHRYIAYSLEYIGRSLEHVGELEEGLNYLKQALEMRKRIYKDFDHPRTAISLAHVGHVWMQVGKLEEGLAYLERGLDMQRRIYEDRDHPDTATSLNYMGDALVQVGKFKKGIAYLEQALNMRQRLYKNRNHPDIADSLSHVAHALIRSGNIETGLDRLKQAIEMTQRVCKDQNHPGIVHMLYKIGDALVKIGMYQKALTYHREALHRLERILKEPTHPLLAKIFYSLGEAMEGLYRLNEAISHYHQAASIALQHYKKEHPHVTKYLDSLIKLLGKVQDKPLIRQIREAVVPLCIQWLGKDHVLTQQLHSGEEVPY